MSRRIRHAQQTIIGLGEWDHTAPTVHAPDAIQPMPSTRRIRGRIEVGLTGLLIVVVTMLVVSL